MQKAQGWLVFKSNDDRQLDTNKPPNNSKTETKPPFIHEHRQ